ncbi:MAG TPA: ABC transporter ATP-binding protein, partial [Thermodesulfobacteriota bacterium]|nr:ABC transporter ATP-binding protein [Thermodesulfobacteriota bacterium]
TLIISDEPVSALDVSIQAQVLNLLSDLRKEFDLTYLFIAHDLRVVEYMSDRVAVMYLGKIMEMAPVQDIYGRPRHPYTEALLSAVPMPNPKSKKERITLSGDVPSPINPPPGCVFHPRCRYRQAGCDTNAPEFTEIEAGHFLSCHYPLKY